MSITSTHSAIIAYPPSIATSKNGTFGPRKSSSSDSSHVSHIDLSPFYKSSIDSSSPYPPDAYQLSRPQEVPPSNTKSEEAPEPLIRQFHASQPIRALVKSRIERILDPFGGPIILYSGDIYHVDPDDHTPPHFSLYVGKEMEIQGKKGVLKRVLNMDEECVRYLFKPKGLPLNELLYVIEVDIEYACTSSGMWEKNRHRMKKIRDCIRIKGCFSF
jgi:hypothetical protein